MILDFILHTKIEQFQFSLLFLYEIKDATIKLQISERVTAEINHQEI